MCCSLLLGFSIFFSIFLLIEKKNRKYSFTKYLLAAILLAFSLRIGKSVIYILFPEYGGTLTAIGIVGMLAIGPLFWFYIYALLIKKKMNYWHFTPMLMLILVLPWLAHNGTQNIKHQIISFIYKTSLVHMLVYFIMGIGVFYQNDLPSTKKQNKKVKWVIIFVSAMFLIWIGFVVQAFLGNKTIYIFVTFSEVLILFAIALVAMTSYHLIIRSPNNSLENELWLENLAKKAVMVLKRDRLYINSNLSISVLANTIGTNSHTLSLALNNYENQSFPKLLNQLRIEYSLILLKDFKNRNLSIEAIAFESGFNSLSVFYRNFKNYKGITPAEYRKIHEQR